MRTPGFRWWIAGLLLLASILNYIDRNALAILAPTIQADLGISDARYGDIVSLFLVAYTLAYLFSGRVVDALGPRLGLALFVGWWSLANLLTGFARSAFSLGGFRFLLGLGEAGGYTASPKVVAEWFPPKERGVAVGVYSVGGSIGATIAPLLVIALSTRWGWRSAFVATGALGLFFVAVWLWVYRNPRGAPAGADAVETPAPAPAPALSEGARWKMVVSAPAVWALMGARLLTDPVWYFFQFWMPKYLHTAHGFAQRELASMWLVFLAADIGFVASGFASGWLMRRGRGAREARLRLMFFCALAAPLAALAPLMPGAAGVFAVAMVVALAHTAWLASITTYVVDLVPAPVLGTAFGFIAAGSAVGGILMNQAVAWAVVRHSYDPCFFAMAALHPLAFALLRRFAGKPWPGKFSQ
jgi:ACS family hexuronate transporter-like MFS transporter